VNQPETFRTQPSANARLTRGAHQRTTPGVARLAQPASPCAQALAGARCAQ